MRDEESSKNEGLGSTHPEDQGESALGSRKLRTLPKREITSDG